MKTALPEVTGDVFSLDRALLAEGLAAARQSPRRRIIQPLHRSSDAWVQRMLNFMLPGTYLRPHLHPRDHATETIQVLQGALGFILFDEDGNVLETCRLSTEPGRGLIDIEARVWHGMVVLEPDTVILEVKRGPYDPERDKVFAEWAPAEGEPECDAFRERWEALFSEAR